MPTFVAVVGRSSRSAARAPSAAGAVVVVAVEDVPFVALSSGPPPQAQKGPPPAAKGPPGLPKCAVVGGKQPCAP